MKARPIIMRAEEVRATLNGSKTQLRRPVKPQPDGGPRAAMVNLGDEWWGLSDGDLSGEWRCPFGGPGDILWAKETWQAVHFSPEYSEGYRTGYSDDWWAAPTIPKDDEAGWWTPAYAADPHHEDHREDRGFAWRSPIYMPRWASRLTLEVLAVRVERVQDISEEDARAEGVTPLIPGHGHVTMKELRLDPGMRTASMFRDGFAYAWSQLHDKPADFGAAWERNDWVWVGKYRRTEQPGGAA